MLNMRLGIRLDAGHAKGMGHLYRMLELARILEKKGCEVVFALRAEETSRAIIQKKGFECLRYSEATDERDIIEDVLTRVNLDAWIYDLLDIEACWIRQIKQIKQIKMNGIRVICVDDTAGGITDADMVINPIAGCWGKPLSPRGQLFDGPTYSILSANVAAYRRERLPSLTGSPYRVGIAMGGSDTHGATVRLAEAFPDVSGRDLSVHFFLGPSFRHGESLEHVLAKVAYSYVLHHSVPDLVREINEMNLLICGGGVTLFEACAMGIPTLALANEPHEAKTIAYFSERRATVNLGRIDAMDPQGVTAAIQRVLNDRPVQQDLSTKGMALVPADGGDRVSTHILSLIRQRI
ncbi:MAG: hypothetical protein ACM3SY_04460 [Candidatus Omnitrophota bacterium]